jgi:hypothetical protein
MSITVARIIALSAGALPLWLVACENDPDQRSEANYCTQVGNHLSDLNAPTIADVADSERVLRSWRAVADSAPLAIEAEWTTMVGNLEMAITVVPNDPASMQKMADAARVSEPAADRVISYTQQRCGAVIGDVAATATTVAPATTIAPATTGA